MYAQIRLFCVNCGSTDVMCDGRFISGIPIFLYSPWFLEGQSSKINNTSDFCYSGHATVFADRTRVFHRTRTLEPPLVTWQAVCSWTRRCTCLDGKNSSAMRHCLKTDGKLPQLYTVVWGFNSHPSPSEKKKDEQTKNTSYNLKEKSLTKGASDLFSEFLIVITLRVNDSGPQKWQHACILRSAARFKRQGYGLNMITDIWRVITRLSRLRRSWLNHGAIDKLRNKLKTLLSQLVRSLFQGRFLSFNYYLCFSQSIFWHITRRGSFVVAVLGKISTGEEIRNADRIKWQEEVWARHYHNVILLRHPL